VGRLLARLDGLGLRRDTLVVFLSDNGFSCGHHGFWGKGNGTHPRNMYENSTRVPAIFSHPGALPSELATDALASMYDVFPTLLDYLGLPARADGRSRPGRSLVPLLKGEPDAAHDLVVVYDEYGPVRMIRTREWKYVHRYPNGPHELYDLVHDPDERQNLAADPGQARRSHELGGLLEDWFTQYAEPAFDGRRETY
jgi:arylsulfatase A-like enzyme